MKKILTILLVLTVLAGYGQNWKTNNNDINFTKRIKVDSSTIFEDTVFIDLMMSKDSSVFIKIGEYTRSFVVTNDTNNFNEAVIYLDDTETTIAWDYSAGSPESAIKIRNDSVINAYVGKQQILTLSGRTTDEYQAYILGDLSVDGNQKLIDTLMILDIDVGNDTTLIYDNGTNTVIDNDNLLLFTNDIGLTAKKKIYLDGGINTYLYESIGDEISFYTNANERFQIDNNGVSLTTIGLRLMFGDNDTYFVESGDDIFNLWTGGNNIQRWETDSVQIYSETKIHGHILAEKYVSNTSTISASADDVPVTSISVLLVNTSGGNITIGGFIGGEIGQILYVISSDNTNNIIIEDDEGTGNQDIKTNTAADVTITNEGGVTLIYDGTYWRMLGL